MSFVMPNDSVIYFFFFWVFWGFFIPCYHPTEAGILYHDAFLYAVKNKKCFYAISHYFGNGDLCLDTLCVLLIYCSE